MSIHWGRSSTRLVGTLEVFIKICLCLVIPKLAWVFVAWSSKKFSLHLTPDQIVACLLGIVAAVFVLCTNWGVVFKGDKTNG